MHRNLGAYCPFSIRCDKQAFDDDTTWLDQSLVAEIRGTGQSDATLVPRAG